MIPKPGKDPSKPEGYRPVTLLPTLGKVLERIIKNDLERFLDDNNLIHNNEFGFRHARSTEDALYTAISRIKHLQLSNQLVAVISLDIRGAFDHARWVDIISACQQLGIPWYIIALLRSYFRARVVTLASESITINRGCPQGSVLGPTLWNLVFNDVLSVLTDTFSSTLGYADDTLLLVAANSQEELSQRTNEATSKIVAFLRSRSLELNVNKTDVIVLDKRPYTTRADHPVNFILVDNTPIPPARSLPYLGVMIDDKTS